MQQLISFVRDHFFIVIIVLGLIYTMFFRKSPLEKRPPNRMPDFGSGPLSPGRPRRPVDGRPVEDKKPSVERSGPPPIERREPPRVEHREPQPEYREPRTGLPPLERRQPPRVAHREPQPEYREPSPVTRPLPADEPEERSATVVASATPPTTPVVPATVVATAEEQPQAALRDDLTRAVVWAEILGPPRARRPFRR